MGHEDEDGDATQTETDGNSAKAVAKKMVWGLNFLPKTALLEPKDRKSNFSPFKNAASA